MQFPETSGTGNSAGGGNAGEYSHYPQRYQGRSSMGLTPGMNYNQVSAGWSGLAQYMQLDCTSFGSGIGGGMDEGGGVSPFDHGSSGRNPLHRPGRELSSSGSSAWGMSGVFAESGGEGSGGGAVMKHAKSAGSIPAGGPGREWLKEGGGPEFTTTTTRRSSAATHGDDAAGQRRGRNPMH